MPGIWCKLKKIMSFKGFNCSQSSPPSPPLEPKSTETTIHVRRSGGSVSSESFSNLFSSRFSLSFKRKCTICLRNLKGGAGEALFTAECSHSFHYKCITNNVKHGNLECPVCRSKWEEIPSFFLEEISRPSPPPPPPAEESRRPSIIVPKPHQANGFVSLEVDRQLNRILVYEAIEEARIMAESGDFVGAQGLLTRKRAEIMSSASAQAGDPLVMWLVKELVDTREKMASSEVYETTGRPFTLSALSSHSCQRATTRGSSNTSGSQMVGYMTPNMVTMVSRSQNLKVSLRAPQLEVGRSSSTSRR